MPESRKGAQHAVIAGAPQPQPVATAASDMEEIVITLNKATHEVVKVARLDETGRRRDLSQDQAAELAGQDFVTEFLDAVDDVYCAGLAEGVGADREEEDFDDDVLMCLLVGRSADPGLRQLDLRGALLRPVLLRRLLRDHVGAAPHAQPRRRPPITDRPRNGSASHT